MFQFDLNRRIYLLWIATLTILILNFGQWAYAAEFEIDEIITAIKQEIQTARAAEEGKPSFEINTVNVTLAVVSEEAESERFKIKVASFRREDLNEIAKPQTYHKLNFIFKPNGASDFSPDAPHGLVEALKRVKASLRKAYNEPPRFTFENFTFELEFAIEEKPDGGIGFQIIELDDIKVQNIATHRITISMNIAN